MPSICLLGMDDDVSMTGKLSLGGYEKQEKKKTGEG
jgi:hypothetical protein